MSTKLAFICVLVCELCGKERASQKCYTAEEFNVVVSAPSTPILIILRPIFVHLFDLPSTPNWWIAKKLFSGLFCHQLNFSADLFESSRLKQAKWCSMASTPEKKRYVFESNLASCHRTQLCWPSTPNIFGCYMSRPFAHPVASCWMLLRNGLKLVKLFSQQLPTFLLFCDPRSAGQQC